jgi:hypothetical protein
MGPEGILQEPTLAKVVPSFHRRKKAGNGTFPSGQRLMPHRSHHCQLKFFLLDYHQTLRYSLKVMLNGISFVCSQVSL